MNNVQNVNNCPMKFAMKLKQVKRVTWIQKEFKLLKHSAYCMYLPV
jgi:hypothetical protein